MTTSSSRHPGSWRHVLECSAAFLLPILGALVVVRVFLLTGVQDLGWRIFWGNVGPDKTVQWYDIFQTMTFWKFVIGAIAGGILGWVLTQRVDARYRQ